MRGFHLHSPYDFTEYYLIIRGTRWRSWLRHCATQGQRWEYAGPRVDHDRAGPEYRYLDWYATTNTDYVNYVTKEIQVLHYGI